MCFLTDIFCVRFKTAEEEVLYLITQSFSQMSALIMHIICQGSFAKRKKKPVKKQNQFSFFFLKMQKYYQAMLKSEKKGAVPTKSKKSKSRLLVTSWCLLFQLYPKLGQSIMQFHYPQLFLSRNHFSPSVIVLPLDLVAAFTL